MPQKTTNVLVAAVGGQGALFAARILGHYACAQGFEVKVSEIHGMAQRGGSVVTHVRFGHEVHSPVIEAGGADALLGFELLEAARYVTMMREGGILIVNRQQIQPLPVLTGDADYPTDLVDRFGELPITAMAIDGLAEAQALGDVRTVNTLLLGAYAGKIGAAQASWHHAIEASVRAAHCAINVAAFDRGYALATASTTGVSQKGTGS